MNSSKKTSKKHRTLVPYSGCTIAAAAARMHEKCCKMMVSNLIIRKYNVVSLDTTWDSLALVSQMTAPIYVFNRAQLFLIKKL